MRKRIKQYKRLAAILYRMYLELLFFYRSLLSAIISLSITFLRHLIIHQDITTLTLQKRDAKLSYYGKSFYWNSKDRNSLLGIAFTGSYEKEELRTMLRFLKPGMRVFDIGANYGLHTVLFAERIGPEGHVYSFEPLRTVYRELKKNVALNGYEERVTAENIALSNRAGKTTIYIPKALGTGASSLRIRWSGENIRQNCVLTTLDQYVMTHKIPWVHFIKCDVEGSEFFVFQGAKETLKRFRPTLFFEAIDNHTKVFGYTIREEIEYLKSFSYNFFLLDGSILRRVETFNNGYYFASV